MVRTPATGNFKKAKSLCGSHISVNVLGKYPPTDPANDRPIVNDFFLNIPLKLARIRKSGSESTQSLKE